MSTFPVVIHHNPDCGTSRNVLGIIQAAGYEPTVIDYLKEGWTRPQLLALFSAAGITVRNAKYPLENATIDCEYQYGISNEVLPGKTAEVSVGEGRLLLIKIRK